MAVASVLTTRSQSALTRPHLESTWVSAVRATVTARGTATPNAVTTIVTGTATVAAGETVTTVITIMTGMTATVAMTVTGTAMTIGIVIGRTGVHHLAAAAVAAAAEVAATRPRGVAIRAARPVVRVVIQAAEVKLLAPVRPDTTPRPQHMNQVPRGGEEEEVNIARE